MSLRRTGVARKTALKRTPMPRAKAALTRRRVEVISRKPRKSTGPTPAQRALVVERAAGCCELCGLQLHDGLTWIRDHSFHHRLPRRAGGSRLRAINLPSNILLVCGSATSPGGCHLKVEAARTTAYTHGWLLHAGQDPATVPVDIGAFHVAVLLTEDGDYQEIAA